MMAISGKPARHAWSTADVESRHALAYWVDTICKSFLEIDIDSPDRYRFQGRLEQTDFGPATLNVIANNSQTVRRTHARIANSRYDSYFVLQLREGNLRFQQYGRECFVEPGDTILVDCGAPYFLECIHATRSLALRFPRDWLRNWVPVPEQLAGRALRPGAGWSGALGAAMSALDTQTAEELALPEGVVAEQIAALLALAAGPSVQTVRGSDKLLARIRRTIRDRCTEPGLTPAAIADTHGISKRYLHHLFAQTDHTFGAELMRARLESAQRMLADARFAALSVSEIATRCGFVEPSHFARRFRQAFGMGPTAFRAGRPARG